MSDQVISAKVYGIPEAIHGIDRAGNNANDRMKDLLDDTANVATFWMHIYAPTGETAYIQSHIARTRLYWHPGGSGGGGSWEVTAGVREGSSRHPLWVEAGTGIYGDHRRPITPRTKSAMVFSTPGRAGRVYAERTRGQRAQPYVKAAYNQAKVYAFTHFKSRFTIF